MSIGTRKTNVIVDTPVTELCADDLEKLATDPSAKSARATVLGEQGEEEVAGKRAYWPSRANMSRAVHVAGIIIARK